MSSQHSATALGSWTAPGSSFIVTYSLAVLQEIEFAVNEGYRRIPHGGIEVGGLLFGLAEENSVRIQAFRIIECEHAFGPSLVLSEHDVNALRQQLIAAGADPELEGLQAIGWFIAHTRSPLQMTDREYGWFGQLFPTPGSITLLVKPERFKLTHFAFLVRDRDGQIERDGSRHAFVLQLPGRSTRPSEVPPARPAEAPPVPAAPPRITPVIEPPAAPMAEAPAAPAAEIGRAHV